MPKVTQGPPADREFQRQHMEAVALHLREVLAPWEVECVGGSTLKMGNGGEMSSEGPIPRDFLRNDQMPVHTPGHRWVIVRTPAAILDLVIHQGSGTYRIGISIPWLPSIVIPMEYPQALERLGAGVKALGGLIQRAAELKRLDEELRADADRLRETI